MLVGHSPTGGKETMKVLEKILDASAEGGMVTGMQTEKSLILAAWVPVIRYSCPQKTLFASLRGLTFKGSIK